MLRVYRYRLNPTPGQERVLLDTLELLRELYNASLQERKNSYRRFVVEREGALYVQVKHDDMPHKPISAYAQMKELPEVKTLRPEYSAMYSQILQDVIKRLDKAFDAFFRRVKDGETPGYPRFKGYGRYHSFTYPQAENGSVKIVSGGKRVRLSSIGNVKLYMHRPMEGRVKNATVTLSGDGHWYISFCCVDVPMKVLPKTGCDIGIDLGLKVFAATSDGEFVENPRPMKSARLQVERAQRKVSRRKKGSNRRCKAVKLLAKHHARVANVRRDHHYKVAYNLVQEYDMIAIEDLNVKGLASGMLAKSFADVGLGDFTQILVNKAESAGRELIKVNPAGTSQRCAAWICSCGWAGHPKKGWCPTYGCPKCGGQVRPCDNVVKKDLSVRVHECPVCKFREDRDVNAALNILRLGRSLQVGAASECTPTI